MSPITLRRRVTVKGRGAALPVTVTQKETIHNNSPFTLHEVRGFPHYGGFMNGWRERYVDVYQPPVEFLKENPATVISIGCNSKTNTTWICVEPSSVYESRIINADWRNYL